MKTRENFRNMFEPADAGFEDAVQRALWGIRRREGSAVRRKLSVGLVFAVLLSLLLAAAALAAAAKWGVLDFVTKGTAGEPKVLPEATELVQDSESIPQTGGRLPDADFSVRQAVYDGNQAYVVVEARPKDRATMLIDGWSDPSGRISNLIRGYGESDTTVEDYGKAHGKSRYLSTEVGTPVGANWFADTGTEQMEEDGTITFMLEGGCKEKLPEIDVELSCFLTPYVKGADGEWKYEEAERQKGVLSFTLIRSDASLERAEYAQPLEYPSAGLRVDRVTLECKPMAVYYEVDYTVTDLKAYEATENGVAFEFLGADGKRIAEGAGNTETKHVGDGDGFGEEAPVVKGGQFIATGSLTAMQALPETVTLSAYNCWDKNRYEAHEIRLK